MGKIVGQTVFGKAGTHLAPSPKVSFCLVSYVSCPNDPSCHVSTIIENKKGQFSIYMYIIVYIYSLVIFLRAKATNFVIVCGLIRAHVQATHRLVPLPRGSPSTSPAHHCAAASQRAGHPNLRCFGIGSSQSRPGCTWMTEGETLPVGLIFSITTMWGPLVISWFISPNNYSYKYHKP